MPDVQRLKSDLLALVILALTVFLGLALISYSPSDPPGDLVYPAPTTLHNLCGPAGARLAHQLHSALGLGCWFLLGGLILFDMRLFARKPVPDPFLRLLGGTVALMAVCGALQLALPRLGTGPIYGSGGFLGSAGRILMTDRLSTGGSAIVLTTLFIAGLLLATDVLLARMAYAVLCGPFLAIGYL
jgi:DNA segregation ATPase FtsK/SpoIIIE, S-DNA-T family